MKLICPHCHKALKLALVPDEVTQPAQPEPHQHQGLVRAALHRNRATTKRLIQMLDALEEALDNSPGADISPGFRDGVNISPLEDEEKVKALSLSKDGLQLPGEENDNSPRGETTTILPEVPAREITGTLTTSGNVPPASDIPAPTGGAVPVPPPKKPDSRPHRKPSKNLARNRVFDELFKLISVKFADGRLFTTQTFTGGAVRAATKPEDALRQMCLMWDSVNKQLRREGWKYEFIRVVGFHDDGFPHFHTVFFGLDVESMNFWKEVKGAWEHRSGMGFCNRVPSNDHQTPEALTQYLLSNIRKPQSERRKKFSVSLGFFGKDLAKRLRDFV